MTDLRRMSNNRATNLSLGIKLTSLEDIRQQDYPKYATFEPEQPKCATSESEIIPLSSERKVSQHAEHLGLCPMLKD